MILFRQFQLDETCVRAKITIENVINRVENQKKIVPPYVSKEKKYSPTLGVYTEISLN